MFLAPVDIHGSMSLNIIAIIKIATNDKHFSNPGLIQFLINKVLKGLRNGLF